ncbi:hypothetical protein Rhow_008004 [Rhodococcus wratislaviensis]|uniref:Uncharacterized protein n=1 Tax=Rhodococcus wratislaviensis TaxID=44752 RepID=A0A402CJB1_RHOWR|nr:hypothetical protein Rhow_008004 [Rhodococcus wratislaviensis]
MVRWVCAGGNNSSTHGVAQLNTGDSTALVDTFVPLPGGAR